MELSGFYKITVKVETETESGKVKKTKETYIVGNCGDPQSAVKVVEDEMSGCMYEWAVESVKEEKISAVLMKDSE